MKSLTLSLAAALALLVGCVRQPDPRVAAAQDFQATVGGLIQKDESRSEKLAALRLGMTDEQVISKAGPPSTRESRRAADGAMIETWTYRGELKTLATLTLENQKLVQVQVY